MPNLIPYTPSSQFLYRFGTRRLLQSAVRHWHHKLTKTSKPLSTLTKTWNQKYTFKEKLLFITEWETLYSQPCPFKIHQPAQSSGLSSFLSTINFEEN